MSAPGPAPGLPGPRWPAPRVRVLQVEELFRFAGTSAAFSFLGALLTLGVLFEVGANRTLATLWFLAATAINVARAFVVFFYRRRDAHADPSQYADAFVVTNFAAGVLFGLLGTVLFPGGPAYAQLFVLMVIICLVAGSVTAYAPVKYAHPALSVPATFPTAFFLFFIRDGVHWFAGIAAIFFCLAIVYYANQLHRHLERGFVARIERDDLLSLQQALQDKVRLENRELAHRVAVRGVRAEDAAVRAGRLEALFEDSPLAQFDCDASGHVVNANAAASRLFALPATTMAGEPIAVFVSGISPQAVATSGPHHAMVEALLPAGGKRTCTASITPWVLGGGTSGFAVVLSGLAPP